MNDISFDPGWRPTHSVWLIAFVVTLAPFMEILDTTIVNVSLPYIAGSMSVSYDDATWTLTSYLVANGIVLPVAGWLGRLIGRKRYFLLCISMFTICSLMCGLATSLPQLVVFRVLQGLFGGGLQPNQQAVVLDTFEPSQRGRAFSIVAFAVIFAPIIGPVLGGWLTDTYSWRWVFLINVPVGMVAFMAVAGLVDDPPWVVHDRADIRDVDYTGLALIALGLGCLQITLDRGDELDWFGSPEIRMFALLAAVGLAGAVAWLLLADKPVVNLRVLKDRNFAVGVICISCIGALLYSSNFIIPSFSQEVMGYTALLAGEVISPGALVMVFLIPVVARLALPNFQTRYLLAFGFFILGCAALYADRLSPDLDFGTMATWRAFQTVGLAFLFVPNSTISYSTIPRWLTPDATALYSMFRNIAGSVGISAAAAILDNRTHVHRAYLAAHLTPLDRAFTETLSTTAQSLRALGASAASAQHLASGFVLHTLNQQAAILAYVDIFTWSAIGAFAVIPLTFLFRPSTALPRG